MAEDDLQDLMTARAALTKKRLSLAQTIASQQDAPESAIKAIVEVQQAIEVIDIAIEELEEAELEELDEAESEDDE
jgi:CHASE3 domain sensor protein